MRVSPDELVYQRVDDMREVEQPALLTHLCIKNHLEEQISKLLCEVWVIAVLYCFHQFIGLLQGRRDDGGKILLQVPGTALVRVTQSLHDPQQIRDAVARLSRSVQCRHPSIVAQI